jgi:hypothetical protein
VHVIDEDLGKSGAGTVERVGFKKLIAEIGLGNAGLVISLAGLKSSPQVSSRPVANNGHPSVSGSEMRGLPPVNSRPSAIPASAIEDRMPGMLNHWLHPPSK